MCDLHVLGALRPQTPILIKKRYLTMLKCNKFQHQVLITPSL